MKNLLFLLTLLSLSACQTSQTKTQPQHKMSSLKEHKEVASITHYLPSITTAILRMKIASLDGIPNKELLFNAPQTIEKTNNYTNYVFHKDGGGAKYIQPNKGILSTPNSTWIFSQNWQIEKLGNHKNKNEIIAFLPYIKQDLCKNINAQYIKNVWKEEDKDQDGIPRGSKRNILPQSKHNMVLGNSYALKHIDTINSATFRSQTNGCYDLSDDNGIKGDGPYVYYHLMFE